MVLPWPGGGDSLAIYATLHPDQQAVRLQGCVWSMMVLYCRKYSGRLPIHQALYLFRTLPRMRSQFLIPICCLRSGERRRPVQLSMTALER
eukprot:scaffold163347_cov31-Prasinocladus_malaysianus.AAC.2